MAKKVLVVMGGFSAEREVSLSSGEGCIKALNEAGYDVESWDLTRDLEAFTGKLQDDRPDVVFNALHGRYGEDGCLQGIFDMLGIPYTHSGVMASALGMNKAASRNVFESAGLPLAEGWIFHKNEFSLAEDEPKRPYVVKPIAEGSSVGVTIVFEEDNDTPLSGAAWEYGKAILVEKYIPGREIQVAVMGERPLGVIEILTDRRFYDYEAKYTPGQSRHLMPAPIHKDAYDEVMALSVDAHACLDCRGVSRVDFRYDDREGEPGKFYLLEVNTQPGMTPTSLVPEIAAAAGISFPDLVSWMVENAECDA